jgi:F-type H+-transporting ATPase subunit delta
MSLAARPYAVAFLDVAAKDYDVPGFLAAADGLRRALSGDARLRAFFGSPAIPESAKSAALAELSRQAGVDEAGSRLLRLILQRRRLLHLEEILAAIKAESDHRGGVVEATVTVPAALSEEQRRAIENAVSRRTGRRVRAKVEIDPSILAGFVARVGSAVFDASAASAIDGFRRQARDQER